MSLRLALWLGAFVIAAVLAVAFVPQELIDRWLSVSGETVTRGIAVAGFVFTVGCRIYDIREKQREQRKKELENEERLKATPHVGNATTKAPFFGVELYNEGSTPINIKSVMLRVRKPTGQWDTYTFYTGDVQNLATQIKLGPKDHAYYRTHASISVPPKHLNLVGLLALPPENFYIEIRSFAEIVAFVWGEELQKLIKEQLAPQA